MGHYRTLNPQPTTLTDLLAVYGAPNPPRCNITIMFILTWAYGSKGTGVARHSRFPSQDVFSITATVSPSHETLFCFLTARLALT